MTVLICLGPTPDTWWQAKNTIGWTLLEKAAQVAPNEAAREAILVGCYAHSLDLDEMESPLCEQVWQAVEQSAREVSSDAAGPPLLWPAEWLEHVADLAREMEARRVQPERPGAWPNRASGVTPGRLGQRS